MGILKSGDSEHLSNVVSTLSVIAEVNGELFKDHLGWLQASLANEYPDIVGSASAQIIACIAESEVGFITKEMIAGLLAHLSHVDADIRLDCARALAVAIATSNEMSGGWTAAELMENLLSNLRDQSNDLRSASCEVIERIAARHCGLLTPEVVQALVLNLSSGSDELRSSSMKAIETIAWNRSALITPAVVENLCVNLGGEDPYLWSTCCRAIAACARVGNESLSPQIVQLLLANLNSENIVVRSACSDVLTIIVEKHWALVTRQVVEKLMEHIGQASERVQMASARVLGSVARFRRDLLTHQMIAGLVRRLLSAELRVCSSGALALESVVCNHVDLATHEVAEALLRSMERESYLVQSACLSTLEAIADGRPDLVTGQWIDALLTTEFRAIFFDISHDVQRSNIFGLLASKRSNLITVGVVQLLISNLQHTDNELRIESARALAAIGRTRLDLIKVEFISCLLSQMLTRSASSPPASSDDLESTSLSRRKFMEPYLDVLRANLLDETWKTRSIRYEVLQTMANDAEELLPDEVESLCTDAHEIVLAGKEVSVQLIESLFAKLKDWNGPVQSASAWFLGDIAKYQSEKITPATVSRIVEKLADSKTQANKSVIFALESIASTFSPIAVRLLDHASRQVREAAVRGMLWGMSTLSASTVSALQLLVIISFDSPTDTEKAGLVGRATQMLYAKAYKLSHVEISELLASFDSVLRSSNQGYHFLHHVCHYILQSSDMPAVARDFILTAVQHRMDMSLTEEGGVLIDGRSYKLRDKLSSEEWQRLLHFALDGSNDRFVRPLEELKCENIIDTLDVPDVTVSDDTCEQRSKSQLKDINRTREGLSDHVSLSILSSHLSDNSRFPTDFAADEQQQTKSNVTGAVSFEMGATDETADDGRYDDGIYKVFIPGSEVGWVWVDGKSVTIDLEGCQLTDEIMSEVERNAPVKILANLDRLFLTDNDLVAPWVTLMKMNLRQLSCLCMSENKLGKARGANTPMQKVNKENFTCLHSLLLGSNRLTHKHMRTLAAWRMPELRQLYLQNNPIKTKGLARLVSEDAGQGLMGRLKRLDISNCELTDQSLKLISSSHCEQLEHLHLSENRFSPLGFRYLSSAKFDSLELLELKGCRMNDGCLSELINTKLPKLVNLDITKNGAVTVSGLSCLAKWGLPKIETLRIDDVYAEWSSEKLVLSMGSRTVLSEAYAWISRQLTKDPIDNLFSQIAFDDRNSNALHGESEPSEGKKLQ